MPIHDRLLRDLKASVPKTAALAAVTSVGLYFWIPPLWRLVVPSDSANTLAAGAETPVTAVTTKAQTGDTPADETKRNVPLSWQTAERVRSSDDLFQAVEATKLRHDAFALNREFLPLHVEFAVDPPTPEIDLAEAGGDHDTAKEGKLAVSEDQELPANSKRGLTLQSTLVGGGGRKALINNRIYAEGERVVADGRAWTLRRVGPRLVVLDSEDESVELRIAPFELKQAQLER